MRKSTAEINSNFCRKIDTTNKMGNDIDDRQEAEWRRPRDERWIMQEQRMELERLGAENAAPRQPLNRPFSRENQPQASNTQPNDQFVNRLGSHIQTLNININTSKFSEYRNPIEYLEDVKGYFRRGGGGGGGGPEPELF